MSLLIALVACTVDLGPAPPSPVVEDGFGVHGCIGDPTAVAVAADGRIVVACGDDAGVRMAATTDLVFDEAMATLTVRDLVYDTNGELWAVGTGAPYGVDGPWILGVDSGTELLVPEEVPEMPGALALARQPGGLDLVLGPDEMSVWQDTVAGGPWAFEHEPYAAEGSTEPLLAVYQGQIVALGTNYSDHAEVLLQRDTEPRFDPVMRDDDAHLEFRALHATEAMIAAAGVHIDGSYGSVLYVGTGDVTDELAWDSSTLDGIQVHDLCGHGLELTLVGEEHGLGLRLKSIDGGLSWEPMPVDVSAPPLTACHADATGVVYVGAEGYLGVETSGWGVEEPPPEEL